MADQFFINKWATEKLSRMILDKSKGTIVVFCPLCQMALKTFSTKEKIVYFTDLILYVTGEENKPYEDTGHRWWHKRYFGCKGCPWGKNMM